MVSLEINLAERVLKGVGKELLVQIRGAWLAFYVTNDTVHEVNCCHAFAAHVCSSHC
jgi:hypothetical protein